MPREYVLSTIPKTTLIELIRSMDNTVRESDLKSYTIQDLRDMFQAYPDESRIKALNQNAMSGLG